MSNFSFHKLSKTSLELSLAFKNLQNCKTILIFTNPNFFLATLYLKRHFYHVTFISVLLFCTLVGDHPVRRSPRFLSPRYRSPRPLITPYIYNPVPHITPSCLSPRPFITTSKFSLFFTPCNFSLPLVKEKLYHYITITVLLYHWYIINITIYYYHIFSGHG